MDEILKVLISKLSFLYKKDGFRFIDSRYSESFGGDGYVILARDGVRIRFLCDKAQLFMEFAAVVNEPIVNWYSTDLVEHLITGKVVESAVLDEQTVAFVKDNIQEILSLLSKEKAKGTESKLLNLKRARSKRMFG